MDMCCSTRFISVPLGYTHTIHCTTLHVNRVQFESIYYPHYHAYILHTYKVGIMDIVNSSICLGDKWENNFYNTNK